MIELDAAVAAVTVFPGRARITRRGEVTVPAGSVILACRDLPPTLDPDSVRVTGRGPVRVRGVDVEVDHRVEEPGRRAELVAELDRVDEEAARLDDERRAAEVQLETVTSFSASAGRQLARQAAADAGAMDRLGPVLDGVSFRFERAAARRRDLARRSTELVRTRERFQRELDELGQRGSDRRVVTIEVDGAPEGGAAVELELTYLTVGATWRPVYDVRLEGDEVVVDWFGMVSQHTDEAWPAGELALSTAQVAGALQLPELAAWVLRPRLPVPTRMFAAASAPMSPAPADAENPYAMAAAGPAIGNEVAAMEQGTTATTYRVGRPVAIEPDGSDHRVLLAQLHFPARVDHVTAPVRSDEVLLRATVTNTSAHTLRPGRAALFHEREFVGSTDLEVWAPGEEVELALGLDDRIRVERTLVRRQVDKAILGGTRRHDVAYRIEVANHGPAATTVTVLDQVPVSRSAEITVRDVSLQPAPTEHTDEGELTWRLSLEPGGEATCSLAFRVEAAKGTEIDGWRD